MVLEPLTQCHTASRHINIRVGLHFVPDTLTGPVSVGLGRFGFEGF